MTTLDERLREAGDALGDPPRVAPPFDALRSRHRQRRRRSMTVGAGALSIVVLCVAVAFAVRDRSTQTPAGSTTPSVASSTSTTTSAAARVQRLENMPRLPASAVTTAHLSRDVGGGRAVVADGILWFVDDPLHCVDCSWVSWADLVDGRVQRATSLSSAGQGAGPIAVGDGAVFVALFKYDGSPYRVRRFDLATHKTDWTVDVPGTHVFGAPKARLVFGAGALWFVEGTLPVVKFDPGTGSVLATIPLPHNGAETTGDVGVAFNRSGMWLVGGDTGTTLIRIDPATDRAAALTTFAPGFTQSLAADDTYVWTTHWANAQPRARLDLARVDAADPSVSEIARIPTAQVAAGDGQVWFLGYVPSDKSADAANHYGVVGRIDPETMKVTGVTELPGIGALDDPQLFVANGSAWVYNASTRAITRVTSP